MQKMELIMHLETGDGTNQENKAWSSCIHQNPGRELQSCSSDLPFSPSRACSGSGTSAHVAAVPFSWLCWFPVSSLPRVFCPLSSAALDILPSQAVSSVSPFSFLTYNQDFRVFWVLKCIMFHLTLSNLKSQGVICPPGTFSLDLNWYSQ